ncbi:5-formyltetrahydrofolate cyclo-ligase [Bifidobacterium sp. W8101]|uniref:5-formyltetrahydrofolate cyclo-ligase n=1 Tax=Bifidobacterium TaxID=1678 RepID=UPI0018DE970A|nr:MULTISPECIES: 5-formyltetrahydrofolate cyclo-ligase [Bifidobacterium]MBI0126487.1 5-formyltetrahydrofolate cyclo-ligase [Bifidobacterium choladohabitans]MBI0128056.1 5-formyltetrahydrofolate cyclo-ligase [Bifidobacterium sp. W8103]MBI0138644.1 5-formyltetrahydrofolate cyclo-ligase [Bifidobacterium sp. W8105]MBI0148386.1 5-formyltetrahydrofolate cyclo-ligase [Bifidobacterium sp. W8107]
MDEQERINAEKQDRRGRLLEARRRIDPAQCLDAGRKLADLLAVQVLAKVERSRGDQSLTVAAFASIRGEIAMDPSLDLLLSRGHRMLIPMLGTGTQVGWGCLQSEQDLDDMKRIPGWRPDEPDMSALPAQALDQADLILVPALAIDHAGIRLGRGGGWYDRALALRAEQTSVVGICWPGEFVEDPLPHLDHDLPVDAVLTPEGFTPTAAGLSRRPGADHNGDE